MHDLLITGGQVLDGTGAPAVAADVAVTDGRISAVGALAGQPAKRTIAAQGRIVCPGFIDMHSHDDFNLPVNPLAAGKTRQGVTTLVNGNCGLSPAPIMPETRGAFLDIVSDLESEMDYAWSGFADYLAAQPATAPNVVQLVGHGAVRIAAMGLDEGAPSAAQLERMRALVAEAMEAGAWGFSTMLAAMPGRFATTEEVVELAKVAQRFGGGYHTHMRDEGRQVVAAVAEALEIGRRSGAPVQISHLKISNMESWGQSAQILALIAQARAEGVRVFQDQYPYVASSGGLSSRLPLWAQEGGRLQAARRLQDPALRKRIHTEMVEGVKDNPFRITDWGRVRIATSPGAPANTGMSLAEIAERDGVDGATAFIEQLIADEGRTLAIYFFIGEDDMRAFLNDPHVCIGSDGLYHGAPGRVDPTKPHPRYFGTFPRVLGRYTRELGLLSLPEAVRRMTGLTASILGLADRGRIAPGLAADLVVFDPAAIAETSTFEQPDQAPVGLDWVLVNGVPVLEDGVSTDAAPGRLLRRH